MTRSLYEQEIARHVLALREALVRHDENLKADTLLQECVPYFLHGAAAIMQAADDQHKMVEHVLEPTIYDRYYSDNPNELPFEQMYQLDVADAVRIPRVGMLRQGLQRFCHARGRAPGDLRCVDLAANDGWMASHLFAAGYRFDVVDLGKGTTKRAKTRLKGTGAKVCRGRIEDAPALLGDGVAEAGHCYDVVVAFEVIEHVRDPQEMLAAMALLAVPDGEVWVSTPNGAVELGEIPEWDKVEWKGHVRVYTEPTFRRELQAAGLKVLDIKCGPDNVLVARAQRR